MSQGSMTTEAVVAQYSHLRARRLKCLVRSVVPCRSFLPGTFTASSFPSSVADPGGVGRPDRSPVLCLHPTGKPAMCH